jgi:cytochrome c biogenesis protein CcdA
MILFLLAYLGGVLTIVSPCILPVRVCAGRSSVSAQRVAHVGAHGSAFAAVATLAAVAGGWAIAANQYGRAAAIILLTLFGLALLFPGLADRLRAIPAGWLPPVVLSAAAATLKAAQRPLLMRVRIGCSGPPLPTFSPSTLRESRRFRLLRA